MAVAKEIRAKIRSVQNTQKITKAMEMVASSKMRRAQEAMAATRPYADKVRAIVGHFAHRRDSYKHPWLEARTPVRRVGYILVSTDKGLCGGLNVNLFKCAVAHIAEQRAAGAQPVLALIGRKAAQFFRRVGGRALAQVDHLGDRPRLAQLFGLLGAVREAYDAGEIDRLYLVRNRFINSMTQRPEVIPLLPIEPDHDEKLAYRWDYLFEPSPEEVVGPLLQRYYEFVVYQAVLENVACEMAARMIAMKAATDNAGEFIKKLNLAYNKERQASITRELSEIVAGAEAV